MRRSLQEYVELVVFGLVALLVGTGLLWLVGWVLSIGGVALKWVAGLLWNLLRFIVPVAIAGGLVYFLVKAAQDRQPKTATSSAGSSGPVGVGSSSSSTASHAPAQPGVAASTPAPHSSSAAGVNPEVLTDPVASPGPVVDDPVVGDDVVTNDVVIDTDVADMTDVDDVDPLAEAEEDDERA